MNYFILLFVIIQIIFPNYDPCFYGICSLISPTCHTKLGWHPDMELKINQDCLAIYAFWNPNVSLSSTCNVNVRVYASPTDSTVGVVSNKTASYTAQNTKSHQFEPTQNIRHWAVSPMWWNTFLWLPVGDTNTYCWQRARPIISISHCKVG